MSRRLKTEQAHHMRAFEFYASLGDKRTFGQVAAEFGVDVNTAKLWSGSFGWKRRLAERQVEMIKQLREQSKVDTAAETERTLKMIRATKNRLMKELLQGTLKGTIGDFVKVVQLERELQSLLDPVRSGEGGSRSVPNVVIYIPDNGRGPVTDPIDITDPRHPDYRAPGTPDSAGGDE